MALTVSMTTDPTTGIPIATISGDVGHDDLIGDIAATLSHIAADDRVIVDLTDADHVTGQHLEHLIANTPATVIIVAPHAPVHTTGRVVTSLAEARRLEPQPTRSHRGDRECTS